MEGAEYIQIVHEYLDTVYRVALSSSKNPHDAEDIVQSTFLKLLEGNREFRDEEHIRRWLIRVTINEAKSLWRSFWRKKVISLEETLEEPKFFEPEKSELFWAVQKLPPRYREVTYLYYYEEYSIKEIAKLLRISETAIQTRLMRAREKLRQQLKEAWK
ncbi:MAG: sigma-70 family RNA polymerase sigma factor [Lachnospiraceae bacterium]|nr:sigma-70 family RNA polymerase sigma factor [Lachnospiraceae bacterium]